MIDVLAFGVLVYAIAVSAWLVLMTVRFQRGGHLMAAMVRAAFVPEKRVRFLSLLSVEGSFLLLATLVWGATVAGLVPTPIGEWLVGGFLVIAITVLGWLAELGLRRTTWTEADRAAIQREAPEILRSLAFMPLSVTVSEEDREPRVGGAP